MTDNFIRIWYLTRKLLYKYQHKELKSPKVFATIYHHLDIVYPLWFEWEDELLKAHKARLQRKRRIANYIKGMFLSYEPQKLFFLTITFHDDAFKASAKTRHTNVQRYLNSLCLDYMANLDYGTKKKREHYHAVIATDKDIFEYSIPHAHIHYKRITSRNSNRLAKYLSKLSNHAQKLTSGKSFHKRGLVEMDALPF